MHNLVKILLPILVIYFFNTSCSDNSSTDPKNQLNADEKQARKIAEQFCLELEKENYSEMAKYVDNSSKSVLKEWSFNEVNYFNNVSFLSVDTCLIKGTKASCVCNFENNSNTLVDTLELNKFSEGWLVHIKWGVSVVNPFIWDTQLELKSKAPSATPMLTDTLEIASFKNAAMLIYGLIHFPENVIGFLEKKQYDEMQSAGLIDYRDSLYSKIELGEIGEVAGWNVYFDYAHLDVSVEYFFNTEGLLKELRFTLITEETDPFAYFQEFSTYFAQQYGKPYNATHVKSVDYYKYSKLKWFIKSYNEEVYIEHREFSLIIGVIGADY